jgi:peptidoglycan/xylan/chitin deacetylase (PgdA/CDA1 family)
VQPALRRVALAVVNRLAPSFAPGMPVILAFHSIPERVEFRAKLECLAKLGKKPLGLRQVVEDFCAGRDLPPNTVVLTFDDGYVDHLDNAAHVLTELRWPATFFVTAGLMSGLSGWQKQRSDEMALPLLSASQVRELASLGFEIGCHSRSHPYLTHLPADQLREEIVAGRAELQEVSGQEVGGFCYPYGDWNAQVREIVKVAGYGYAVGTARAAVGRSSDRWALPRMTPPERATMAEFQGYVTGAILPWLSLRRRALRLRRAVGA